ELALERGEKPGAVPKANSSLVQATITEHASSRAPPPPPTLPAGATLAIEGHVPRQNRPKDDDDDDDPQDWDKHLPGCAECTQSHDFSLEEVMAHQGTPSSRLALSIGGTTRQGKIEVDKAGQDGRRGTWRAWHDGMAGMLQKRTLFYSDPM
ncbi:hypothetical protein SVAN01_12007, partial [Stagonosporopsis vannaccii]